MARAANSQFGTGRNPRSTSAGAALVEYALVLSLLVLGLVEVLGLLGDSATDYQSGVAQDIGREQVWLPNTTTTTIPPTTAAPTTTTTTVPTTTTTSTTVPTTATTGPTTTDPLASTSTLPPTTTTTTAPTSTTTTTVFIPPKG